MKILRCKTLDKIVLNIYVLPRESSLQIYYMFKKISKHVLDKKLMTHFCDPFFLSMRALKSIQVAKIGTFIYFYTYSRENKMDII